MGQGKYWECEHCKKKIFKKFPPNWIHLEKMIIQVGKGIFLGNYRDASFSDRRDYDSYNGSTFCSVSCFLQWFKGIYGTKNPSKQ